MTFGDLEPGDHFIFVPEHLTGCQADILQKFAKFVDGNAGWAFNTNTRNNVKVPSKDFPGGFTDIIYGELPVIKLNGSW